MQDFQKIGSWQKSHALTLKIYEATNLFPQTEIYGLISQMRRSSASVPTNIAEGCGRDGVAELKRFMTIALGSASELHYQLILARDLRYLDTNQFQELERDIIEVKRMIAGYIRSLKSDN
jgi:four helix bundle protein